MEFGETALERIGKYKILSKIGQGGMGVVYKALDPKIDRILAIKMLTARLDAEADLRARFLQEARSAAQLSHKNIITIFDYDEEDGLAYIAMEFLDGEDLKAKIAGREPLTLLQKLRILSEVAEGLSHAHGLEIIHRDVKPGNIFVTHSGQIKILDFGLARIKSSELTRSGVALGTPAYMSPEQLQGEPVDFRSDIFSVGVVLYELLTYHKPFPGDSDFAISLKIVQHNPEPVETLDASIPQRVSAIVSKALEKSPSLRFQSMRAFHDALAAEIRRLEAKDAKSESPPGSPAAETSRRNEGEVEGAAGFRLLAEQRYQESLDALLRARALLGEDTVIQVGITEAESGKREQELLRRIEAGLEEGRQAARDGDPGKSREALRKVLELSPRHQEAQRLLADLDQAQSPRFQQPEDRPPAQVPETNLSPPEELDVTSRSSRRGLSEILHGARGGWTAVAAAAVLVATGLLIWGMLRPGTVSDLETRIEEARGMIAREQYDDAIRLLQDVSPGSAHAQDLLELARKGTIIQGMLAEAQKLEQEERLEDSREIYDRILQIDPGNNSARELRKNLDVQMAGALSPAEKAIRVQGILAQARSQLSSGRILDAISEIDRALAISPEDAAARNLMSEAQRHLDTLRQKAERASSQAAETQRAAESVRAAELVPEEFAHARGLAEEGRRLHESRLYAQAESKSLQAMEAFRRAEAAARNESARIAESEASERIRIRKQRAEELERQASAHFREGRYGEALRAAEEGLALDAQNAAGTQIRDRSRQMQGLLERFAGLLASGNTNEAARLLQEIEILNPADPQLPKLRNSLLAAAPATGRRPPPTLDREVMARRNRGERIVTYPAEHDHRVGKCTGKILLDGLTAEFRTEESDHGFLFPFTRLNLKVVEEKLVFLDSRNNEVLETLRAQDSAQAQKVKRTWDTMKSASR